MRMRARMNFDTAQFKKKRQVINHRFRSDSHSALVPTTGFEPAHLMAPPPQDGMSTNFTTWAEYSPCEFPAKILLFRNEKAVLPYVIQKR